MRNNKQPDLFCAAFITYTIAFTALVMRMCARRMTKKPLIWHDYLAVVALVFGSGFNFIVLFKTRWGLGRRIQDINLPLDVIERHYYIELFADMIMYTLSVGLSKVVILGLYWCIFQHTDLRQPIRILFVLSTVWMATRFTLILLFCRPVRKLWDPSVLGDCPMGPMTALFATAIPHLIIEVSILLCPMIEICKLSLSLSKKIAVGLLFAAGLLVCGAALGSIITSVKVDKSIRENGDLTWDSVDTHIWALCDVNLACFSTSLPLLRPIFQSLHKYLFGLCSPSTTSNDAREQRPSDIIQSDRLPTNAKASFDSAEFIDMDNFREETRDATSLSIAV